MIEPEYARRALADLRIGVMEIPGPGDHPRIVEYHSHTTLKATDDEVPWCSSAVCCWLEESEIRSTRSARARSYLNWGIELPLGYPLPWCIGVLSRGANSPGPDVIKAPGHVALYAGQPSPGEVLLVGGNQSNKVCARVYPMSRVLGWRAFGG